jgi:hypothetical protein
VIAAYKSPLNLDKLNCGVKNLEVGMVIDENLDVTVKNIEDVLPLENRIAMQKIRHVNQVTGMTHEDTVEKRNRNTLSVWGKAGNAGNFVSANHTNGIRPFSAVLRNDTLNNQRGGQMREIEDIKNRMNRYKISCPFGKIERALLNPIEEAPVHRDDLALPKPGSG